MKSRSGFTFGMIFTFLLASSFVSAQTPQLVSPPDTWPRDYVGPKGGHLTLYQPQIGKWQHYTTLEARAAGGLAMPGQKNPQFGTFQFTGHTDVDPITRQVRISHLQLSEINFPTLDPTLLPTITQTIQNMLPSSGVTISMDRILASLARDKSEEKAVEVKNDPPPIYFSEKPAILVIINGDPVWSPIVGTDLKYAVNTNWDLFQDPAGNFYLRNKDVWLKSAPPYTTWTADSELPPSFSKLPRDNDNWKDVLASLPGKKIAVDQVPTVFVSKVPAEMIVTVGPPLLEAIPGTQLSWVKNTTSDLFVYAPEKSYYFLTSGRWFKSPGGNGSAWIYATNQLPNDFKLIPQNNPKASVLASVPGTQDSEEAIIQAGIPVKAKIKRSEAKASVSYAGGDPKFDKIKGTDLQYATNTSSQVISYKDKYYLVKDGVWFVSSSAQGPWVVADNIPSAIYEIPPSSPLYNVTYVKVYDSDPEYVTVGYTAGYTGAFLVGTALGATLAFGTGWYYPPYVYGGWYYPYPYSYGMAAYYNPWTGTYGRYGTYYGPYGGVGYGEAVYNPATGTYARGGVVYDPYGGYRAGAQAYNPWTNTYAATRQGSNGYSSWGSSVVERNDDWARTARYSNGQNGVAGYNTSAGNHGFVAKDNGDIYAGRDGNVYRNTGSGWQKYDNGSWNNVGGQNQLGSKNNSQNNLGSEQNKNSLQNKAQENGRSKESVQSKAEQSGRNQGLFQNSGHDRSSSSMNSELGQQLSRDWANRDRGNQRFQGFQSSQGWNSGRGLAGNQGGGGFFEHHDFGGGGWGGGGGGFERGGGGWGGGDGHGFGTGFGGGFHGGGGFRR